MNLTWLALGMGGLKSYKVHVRSQIPKSHLRYFHVDEPSTNTCIEERSLHLGQFNLLLDRFQTSKLSLVSLTILILTI